LHHLFATVTSIHQSIRGFLLFPPDYLLQEGRDLLTQSLQYLKAQTSSGSRLAIVLRSAQEGRTPTVLEKAILATNLLPARRSKIPDFLLAVLALGTLLFRLQKQLSRTM